MGERLSTKRARPRFRFALPGYPTLTVGLCLCLSSGCGSGQASDELDPPPSGSAPNVYDAAPAPQDLATREIPMSSGIVAFPYDAAPGVDADDTTSSLPGDPSVVPTLVTSPPNPDKTK